MTGIVLLPGAGMSAWLWDKITGSLDIPTVIISPRIENNTAENRLSVTFEALIEYHMRVIESKKWDAIIIVGHSGAGIIAGILGKRLNNVVEVIFVAANIPDNKTTAIDIFPEETRQKTIKALQQQAEQDEIAIKTMGSFFIATFANNCSESDREFILKQYFLPEPLCVITAKMDWDNYPAIRKTYIVCTKDKTLTEGQQLSMASNLAIENVIKLDTDHLPMLSASDEFVLILKESIQRFS